MRFVSVFSPCLVLMRISASAVMLVIAPLELPLSLDTSRLVARSEAHAGLARSPPGPYRRRANGGWPPAGAPTRRFARSRSLPTLA